jgi:glycosyltransferase involved in cell wall biosynthesis
MTKPQVDFAIVIPTLNEEHYIGILLDSIANQTILPEEIVVVDAFSTDQTIQEIKKRQKTLPQLKYYQIPKYTISRQRNLGVQKTKSPNILFLDADMKLHDKDTMQRYTQEISAKHPDIAACENMALSKDIRDIIFFKGWDLFNRLIRPFWPVATTMNLYVHRHMFNHVGGFDEQVRIWEDCDLIQRMVKEDGQFILLNKPKMYTSVRRFQKEGRLHMTIKTLQAIWHIIFYGYRNIQVQYEFGHFKK